MSDKEILNAILEAVQKTNARLDGLEKKFEKRFDDIDAKLADIESNFKRLEEEMHFAIKKTLENREAIRALTNIKKITVGADHSAPFLFCLIPRIGTKTI
ncbi:hypothetical protein JQC72_15980 [Polycladomyces sp. WAk]|uniref:Uncharacterized protein n=1 Tax=Polycladomyces zharkentensis TaxID=2807616 RepID=A0ABS2WNE2_9BACL|nr:hypothetical protein [Polycladomyces sp. WAk]MBN2910991.1 hypothetical protein [Polycladomyces sp. WAk]